jgi:hypothetical protein
VFNSSTCDSRFIFICHFNNQILFIIYHNMIKYTPGVQVLKFMTNICMFIDHLLPFSSLSFFAVECALKRVPFRCFGNYNFKKKDVYVDKQLNIQIHWNFCASLIIYKGIIAFFWCKLCVCVCGCVCYGMVLKVKQIALIVSTIGLELKKRINE